MNDFTIRRTDGADAADEGVGKTAAIAQVASAFAAKESSTVAEILELVDGLTRAFNDADDVQKTAKPVTATPVVATQKPAVDIKDAVQPDKVYCLCCGGAFKMLKRHLKAEHGLTEQQYRDRFGLPDDFPLVAPDYSARKAEYARSTGLGKHSRGARARS